MDYQLRLSQELKKSLRDSGVLPTKETPSKAATTERLPDLPEELVPKPRSRTTLNEVNNVECEFESTPLIPTQKSSVRRVGKWVNGLTLQGSKVWRMDC